MSLGAHIRALREAKQASDPSFSLRQLAERLGVEPSYLSRIERDAQPPSESLVVALAATLGEDPDVLLAMAGKVSKGLLEVILHRPKMFAAIIQALKDASDPALDHALVRIVREVRDGNW